MLINCTKQKKERKFDNTKQWREREKKKHNTCRGKEEEVGEEEKKKEQTAKKLRVKST